jgi:hypothetical protein
MMLIEPMETIRTVTIEVWATSSTEPGLFIDGHSI